MTVPIFRLGGVVAAAAAVRVVIWGLSTVIGADGPAFLEVAARFASGDLDAALRHDYHPLYPLLVAAASSFGGAPQFSGEAVSFLFGVLTPIPLFFLARRFIGDGPALAAGLLLALHPVAARLSVDVKSDSTYTFLFVCAVLYCWVAIRSQRPSAALLAGAIAGLGYLARPEGLGVVMVGAGWLLFTRGTTWRRRFVLTGALVLGAALPTAPYVAAISYQDGKFQITRKKRLSDFIGAAPRPRGEVRRAGAGPGRGGEGGAGRPAVRLASALPLGAQGTPARMLREGRDEMGIGRKVLLAMLEVIVEFVQTFHPLLLLLLAGVLLTKAIPRERAQEVFLAGMIFAYLGVLFLLVLGVGYLSRRHVLPLTVIALPWSAAGVWECVRWAAPRAGRWRLAGLLSPRSRGIAILLGATALVLGPKTFYPQRPDHLDQREAGLWIRAVSGGNPEYVLTHMEKVAYYAGARQIPIQRDYRTAIDIARHFHARYAAILRENVDRAAPGFSEAILQDETLARRATWHYEGGDWLDSVEEYHLDVYEILYPQPGPR